MGHPLILCGDSKYGAKWIVDNHLKQDSLVYSFGVGEDISFDLDVNKNFGSQIRMFDPTPKAVDFIKKQVLPKNMFFYSYGIGNTNGEIDFSPPVNPAHVSYRQVFGNAVSSIKTAKFPVKTLNTIMSELSDTYIDCIKADVEGAEFDLIDQIYNMPEPPSMLLIEFHEFASNFFDRFSSALSKLTGMGYQLACKDKDDYTFIR